MPEVFVETLKECLGKGKECRECVETALQEALRETGYADFDRLIAESLVEGVLVNEEPLHVGAGAEAFTSPVDLSVVRVRRLYGNELVTVPVIPGSSLKGVLRSLAEAYAAARGFMNPEFRESGLSFVCTAEGLPHIESSLRTVCKDLAEKLGDKGLRKLFSECIASPVIGLFGAPWLASHINVYNAYPMDLGSTSVSVITRVGIDRFTGSQAPNILYTMEYVEPGSKWKFRLRLFNIMPGDSRWELVNLIFKALTRGVLVGRRTSAGMGLVRLLENETQVKVITVTDEGVVDKVLTLKEWLEGGWTS